VSTGLVVAVLMGGRLVLDTDAEPLRAAALTASGSGSAGATTTTPRLREATIGFAGDVRIHSDVWNTAAVTGGYDFSPMLAAITPRLANVDLALCHLDVTLARPSETLSGYPRFGAPRELARDLAEAGFDGCSVAGEHALDFGEAGVVATLDGLDVAGLGHVGTARTAEERRPATYEVNGIRVAHLSYASGALGRPAGEGWLVDEIDPVQILADAHAARAGGAELVVVSLHWGEQYVHDVVAAQHAVADALAADAGAVDLVVGHHAHVVQPISKVGALWVVWGMGDLLTDRPPSCCTTDTADGVIVTVTIGDTAPGGPVGVTGLEFTPTWNERGTFQVLPVEATLVAQTESAFTDALEGSLERTTRHILSAGGADLGLIRSP
jgi:poly-gamma-glutamate synthesis protein (capsule biosynthesis protein)